MGHVRLTILSEAELRSVHEASLAILRDTGVLVPHAGAVEALTAAGGRVEAAHSIVHLDEAVVRQSLERSAKRFVLHGRNREFNAAFGLGNALVMSSPGQQTWFDWQSDRERPATLDDVRDAIRLGDALPNISVVGAMAQPVGLNALLREVTLAAELLKGTRKPTRSWVSNVRTADLVLDLHRAAAGGEAPLRAHPTTEGFLTPISPLQFPADGLDIVLRFVGAGQPVCIASMPMASGTAPATLAGVIALANAEVLAGIAIVQSLAPGNSVLYGGIPHLLDPRTTLCSFGAPEQGLMAVAMAQLGHSYGLPVYLNVGLTDANALDFQAGVEKGASLVLGALAGADLVGHAGIRGADQGASLLWLGADDELMACARRLLRGIDVTASTLATDVVSAVSPGGSFLAEPHTVEHLRREFWIPGPAWSRQAFRVWESGGRREIAERIREQVRRVLVTHRPPDLAPDITQALDEIVAHAARAFV